MWYIYIFLLKISNSLWSFSCLSSVLYLGSEFNLGFLLMMLFVLQFVSGFYLTTFFASSLDCLYFKSFLFSEINYGWLVSDLHLVLSHYMFLVIYFHILKNLFYPIYIFIELWFSGICIYILCILICVTGYSLVFGLLGYLAVLIVINIIESMFNCLASIVLFSDSTVLSYLLISKLFSYHICFSVLLIYIVKLHIDYLHKFGSSLGLFSGFIDRSSFFSVVFYSDLYFVTLCFLFMSLSLFYFMEMFLNCDNFIYLNFVLGIMGVPYSSLPEWYVNNMFGFLKSFDNSWFGVSFVLLFLLFFLVGMFFKEGFGNNLFSISCFIFIYSVMLYFQYVFYLEFGSLYSLFLFLLFCYGFVYSFLIHMKIKTDFSIMKKSDKSSMLRLGLVVVLHYFFTHDLSIVLIMCFIIFIIIIILSVIFLVTNFYKCCKIITNKDLFKDLFDFSFSKVICLIGKFSFVFFIIVLFFLFVFCLIGFLYLVYFFNVSFNVKSFSFVFIIVSKCWKFFCYLKCNKKFKFICFKDFYILFSYFLSPKKKFSSKEMECKMYKFMKCFSFSIYKYSNFSLISYLRLFMEFLFYLFGFDLYFLFESECVEFYCDLIKFFKPSLSYCFCKFVLFIKCLFYYFFSLCFFLFKVLILMLIFDYLDLINLEDYFNDYLINSKVFFYFNKIYYFGEDIKNFYCVLVGFKNCIYTYSEDVIHSLGFFSLGVTVDSVPGSVSKYFYFCSSFVYSYWFFMSGNCLELCGVGHSFMVLDLVFCLFVWVYLFFY